MKMTDADGVRQHVFTGLLEAFPQELQEAEGFAPVRALIEQENTLRTSADAIDTTLSKNMVLQYILNYPYERTFSDKEELRVLDIEPQWVHCILMKMQLMTGFLPKRSWQTGQVLPLTISVLPG